MTTRTTAPTGAPCWADLWTSDVAGARRFYADLLGWEAQEPSPEFGGYFMFHRHGVGVAGGMGDMGEAKANDTWKMYLATEDVHKTLEVAEAAGAQVVVPAMPVADLGVQAVLVDPTGATVGLWQPGTFPGFTTLNEHGAPSWFELHTEDFSASAAFYGTLFGWELTMVANSDEFRYATVSLAGGEPAPVGLMDARAFLAEGEASHWDIYWEVDDVAASLAKVEQLGGSRVMGPDPTPYGVLAVASDPAGASFKLRTSP